MCVSSKRRNRDLLELDKVPKSAVPSPDLSRIKFKCQRACSGEISGKNFAPISFPCDDDLIEFRGFSLSLSLAPRKFENEEERLGSLTQRLKGNSSTLKRDIYSNRGNLTWESGESCLYILPFLSTELLSGTAS